MPSWIDFKELRSKLKFEDVLKHYAVEVKRRGNQHVGFCPLPGHQGNKNSQSFSANLEKGIFHCFGCQAKGNLLDFAVLMCGESPEDGRGFRKVAIKLRERFCPETRKPVANKRAQPKAAVPESNQLELPVVENAPFDFQLQGLVYRFTRTVT